MIHLPEPHIWQLTPTHVYPLPQGLRNNAGPTQSLVVTMKLHVGKDLCDDDVLQLTRWAWERCVAALGSGKDASEPEVTVGFVRV